MQLVKSMNNPIHSENYEDKWTALRYVVDRVFYDLQRLSVEAQNQALNNWFQEVIKSMKSVEVNRNKMYISNSPFYLDLSTLIFQSVKEDLDTSWITKVFIKSQEPALKEKKMKDPDEEKKVEKLQEALFEQKLISESLTRQLAEMKEEQKAIQEAQAKRS